jgi:hypothetical protein
MDDHLQTELRVAPVIYRQLKVLTSRAAVCAVVSYTLSSAAMDVVQMLALASMHLCSHVSSYRIGGLATASFKVGTFLRSSGVC